MASAPPARAPASLLQHQHDRLSGDHDGPSYAGQIVTFTFPHIGNVGANKDDIETQTSAALGLVLRADITEPSNWRATQHFDAWLKSYNLVGIAGVDTRALTRRIRDRGAPNGTLCHAPDGKLDITSLRDQAHAWPGLEGMDLAKEVTCRQTYSWDRTGWEWGKGYGTLTEPRYKVVAIDYGAKRNILRLLAGDGCASRWCRRVPPPRTSCAISRTGFSSRTAPAIPPPPANMRFRC